MVRQKGMATLAVSVTLILAAGIAVTASSKGILFEQKTSNNNYWATLAHEAAQAGVEETLAWINSLPPPSPQPSTCSDPNPWANACWIPDTTTTPTELLSSSTTDQRYNQNRIVTTANGFTTTVLLRRDSVPLSKINFVEVISRAVSNNDSTVTSTVKQTVFMSPLTSNAPAAAGANAPILIKECIDDVTGTPDICPKSSTGGNPCTAGSGTPGYSIATINTGTASSCLQSGHFDLHGGSLATGVGQDSTPPPTTVWEVLFPGMSKTQMKDLSDLQVAAGLSTTSTPKRTVYYYTPGTFANDDHGSATEPVIVIVECGSSCPKMNGGTDIYGVVYFDKSDDLNGWGNASIHGTFAVEGSIEKFTANTEFHYNDSLSSAIGHGVNVGSGKAPRVAGGWRDY